MSFDKKVLKKISKNWDLVVQGSSKECKKPNKIENEDRILFIDNLDEKESKNRKVLLGVFDGHGGSAAKLCQISL